MSVTELSNLPILVACHKSKANGVCGRIHVRVIPHDVLLRRRHNSNYAERAENLREYIDSLAAAVAGDRQEIDRALECYPRQHGTFKRESTTLTELDHTINNEVYGTRVVIWRGRKTNFRRLGLLCNNWEAVEALLILLHYSSIELKFRTECMACGKMMESRRPSARKTCSGTCRKRLSRTRSAKLQLR